MRTFEPNKNVFFLNLNVDALIKQLWINVVPLLSDCLDVLAICSNIIYNNLLTKIGKSNAKNESTG